jgi:hypothetical protein
LIEKVVDAKWSYWDSNYGWVGSIHDWVYFQKTNLGNHVMKDKFLLFKWLGNVVYSMQP